MVYYNFTTRCLYYILFFFIFYFALFILLWIVEANLFMEVGIVANLRKFTFAVYNMQTIFDKQLIKRLGFRCVDTSMVWPIAIKQSLQLVSIISM